MRTFIINIVAIIVSSFGLGAACLVALASVASAAEPVKLFIASIDNADMQLLRELSPHFERANPDIRLHWLMLGERDLRQRLPVDIAAGSAPFDLVTAGAYEVALWARKGWLQPMTALPPDYAADDLIDEVRQSLTVDGKLQALPFYAEGVLTYYRADLLRRKGLAMPATPDWDDLVRLAAALHDPDAGVAGICLRGQA